MTDFHGVVPRRPVDEAVATMLASATGKPVGRGRAPGKGGDDQDVAEPPYLIVYAIVGGAFWGAEFGDHEDSAGFAYNITSVGLRDDQAQWLADAVRQAMCGRNADGSFVNALTATDINITLREAQGSPNGAVTTGKISSVADTYVVRASLR